MSLTITFAPITELPAVEQLAHRIWPVAYGQILSPEQLAYMLKLIYSNASLRRQMLEEGHQFIMARMDGEPVGFASWSHTETAGVFKLHKLYVLPECQGKGIGQEMLQFLIAQLPPEATALRLNVNRNNKARLFYEKLGFSIISEEDIDIGEGYFMIDYVMALTLPSSLPASYRKPGSCQDSFQ